MIRDSNSQGNLSRRADSSSVCSFTFLTLGLDSMRLLGGIAELKQVAGKIP